MAKTKTSARGRSRPKADGPVARAFGGRARTRTKPKSKPKDILRRKTKRPNIDEYFMKMSLCASERSTCRRHSVGAILVKNKIILSTGYNGAAKGAKDCLELGCLRDELGIKSGEHAEICRAIHAEQNAIIQASSKGLDIEGATMYCTHSPCIICAKMIANAGIKEVVVFQKYPDKDSRRLFRELRIKIRMIKRPNFSIDFYE